MGVLRGGILSAISRASKSLWGILKSHIKYSSDTPHRSGPVAHEDKRHNFGPSEPVPESQLLDEIREIEVAGPSSVLSTLNSNCLELMAYFQDNKTTGTRTWEVPLHVERWRNVSKPPKTGLTRTSETGPC